MYQNPWNDDHIFINICHRMKIVYMICESLAIYFHLYSGKLQQICLPPSSCSCIVRICCETRLQHCLLVMQICDLFYSQHVLSPLHITLIWNQHLDPYRVQYMPLNAGCEAFTILLWSLKLKALKPSTCPVYHTLLGPAVFGNVVSGRIYKGRSSSACTEILWLTLNPDGLDWVDEGFKLNWSKLQIVLYCIASYINHGLGRSSEDHKSCQLVSPLWTLSIWYKTGLVYENLWHMQQNKYKSNPVGFEKALRAALDIINKKNKYIKTYT